MQVWLALFRKGTMKAGLTFVMERDGRFGRSPPGRAAYFFRKITAILAWFAVASCNGVGDGGLNCLLPRFLLASKKSRSVRLMDN